MLMLAFLGLPRSTLVPFGSRRCADLPASRSNTEYICRLITELPINAKSLFFRRQRASLVPCQRRPHADWLPLMSCNPSAVQVAAPALRRHERTVDDDGRPRCENGTQRPVAGVSCHRWRCNRVSNFFEASVSAGRARRQRAIACRSLSLIESLGNAQRLDTGADAVGLSSETADFFRVYSRTHVRLFSERRHFFLARSVPSSASTSPPDIARARAWKCPLTAPFAISSSRAHL